MIRPIRAPVKPRVISPEIGDAIPLEDVWLQVQRSSVRAIEIVGAAGSGKTTAIAHLAANVPPDLNVLFLDDASLTAVGETSSPLVVFTSLRSRPLPGVVSYRLAPWGNDELLEYLLAVHPLQCRSVMARLRTAPDRRLPEGLPELWRVVLDRMAEDESLKSVSDALHRELAQGLPTTKSQANAEDYCLAALTELSGATADNLDGLRSLGVAPQFLRLMRYDPIRLLLATDYLAWLLETKRGWKWLQQRLPRELVQAAAAAASPVALRNLSRWVKEYDACQAMAASLLHATGRGWTPGDHPLPRLSGAYLNGATWRGLNLAEARIEETDLSNCDLTGAVLDGAWAERASFCSSLLHQASLVKIQAAGADFERAVLTSANARSAILRDSIFAGADLTGTCLAEADLHAATLTDARLASTNITRATLTAALIEGADFSSADLRWSCLNGLPLRTARFQGALFAHSHLKGCDLEGMDLPGADFAEAHLHGALLTGSRMPRARFVAACLQGAGLADIDWEEADLRNADMRNCTFHLGSSRSGLVGSPIASEGSRTGFYGDDFDQQMCHAPEEIRKANLCGADLRNAQIEGTDFYLVDLRRAKYTREQFEHLRRCRAILFNRV